MPSVSNNELKKEISIAIIGSGPSALMMAHTLAISLNKNSANFKIHVYEKESGLARKLLIAGSSGLNISNDLDKEEFSKLLDSSDIQSTDVANNFIQQSTKNFFTKEWLSFLESTLFLKTFLGSSGRYFVEEMHSAYLLKEWKTHLEKLSVQFFTHTECLSIEKIIKNDTRLFSFKVTFKKNEDNKTPEIFERHYDAIGLNMGGASWLKKNKNQESAQKLPATLYLENLEKLFASKKIKIVPFESANCGFHVNWDTDLIKEVEGLPLKNIVFKSILGEKAGDLTITLYGLEGTPVYFYGCVGPSTIDLAPKRNLEKLITSCYKSYPLAKKKNLTIFQLIKKIFNTKNAKSALLFHYFKVHHTTFIKNKISSDVVFLEFLRKDFKVLNELIHHFPIELLGPRPLEEAISSKGGISLSEIDSTFMLKKMPGVFVAGEMLNWHLPTGGFLIQMCVSQGHQAALGILSWLETTK